MGALSTMVAIAFGSVASSAHTQTVTSIGQNESWDSARIHHEIAKVDHVPRVLYVAAHPDDENTQLIAYLSAVRRVNVAYLSLTRGDGGQNMIGAEQGELLGMVRSQELLRARGIDGARQFFTRARDFGFSKSAEETLRIWGEDQVLSDVVRIYRMFRPHVVITRFPEEGQTHGHHLASARLARLAFEAAGDPARFPEQLDTLQVWQPTRLLYNVPNWAGARGADETVDFRVSVSELVPALGASIGELAARSRTMHKSQAFGRAAELGALNESFRNLGGTPAKSDLLEGLPGRLRDAEGGAQASAALAKALEALKVDAPWQAVSHLIAAYQALDALKDPHLKELKKAELTTCLVRAAGITIDLRAPVAQGVVGEALTLELLAINRGPLPFELRDVTVAQTTFPVARSLNQGTLEHVSLPVTLPKEAIASVPYWLREPALEGVFAVPNPEEMAWPLGAPPVNAQASLKGPRGVTLSVPAVARHVRVDSILGERAAPLQVVPEVLLQPKGNVVLLHGGTPRVFWADAIGKAPGKAEIVLPVPEGWSVQPPVVEITFTKPDERVPIGFEINAPAGALPHHLTPRITVGGKTMSAWSEDTINHPHLPPMSVLRPMGTRAAPVDIAPLDLRIGYVMGSGDKVPEVLRQLDLKVEELDDDTLQNGKLSDYDTIVMGVRALNVREAAVRAHQRLMDYVAGGGHLVVQYNTNAWYSTLKNPVGPFPLEITRARVTDESAPVEVLLPQHRLVTQPHLITERDFQGWVQERGLYFAEQWDPRYDAVFSMADPHESPQHGALLIAHHGRGSFIYTGLSFFRQLPAGIPGAIRLFLNLVAYRRD